MKQFKTMEEAVKYIEYLQTLVLEVDSLNRPIGDKNGDADTELGWTIPNSEPNMTESVIKKDKYLQLEKYIDTLSPRESIVIKMRFGFVNGHGMTLEQVGEEFGVTRERVRQIEAKALRKLRHYVKRSKICEGDF